MEYHWGVPVIIIGLFVSLMWAWRKINKLEAESRDHFKQIDILGNELARLQMELHDKKVIDSLE